jgi:hypothetical protein
LKFPELQSFACHDPGFAFENEDAQHGVFGNPNNAPLRKIAELGRSGIGFMNCIQSTISYGVYAREIIP